METKKAHAALRVGLVYFICSEKSLLAHIRQQSHESCALDCVLDRSLERSAVAAALAAEELALTGTHLLQALYIFVIDKGRPRAAFFGAKPTTILTTPSQLLTDH